MTHDPGMDRSPDAWQSPKIDLDFRDEIPQTPTPDNDADPYGEITHFAGAGEMHAESIGAIAKVSGGVARLINTLRGVNYGIIQLTQAGGIVSGGSLRSARLRVQWIIISRATAGDAVIGIGTESFTFTVAAAPVRVDFPLVVGEGVDLTYTGDGRVYLIVESE